MKLAGLDKLLPPDALRRDARAAARSWRGVDRRFRI